ncbi:hypothetical protein N9878_00330 [bacterium]|nr:hypothetical protein [bacterium]
MKPRKSMLSSKEEALWGREINRALTWRKKFSHESLWPEIERIYQHDCGSNVPRFNLIFMQAQTLIPNLVYQSPGVINTPTRSGMVQWAALFDGLDNWWIQHCEMKGALHDMVLSAFLKNTAVVQIGYDFDMEAANVVAQLESSENRTRASNAAWLDNVPPHRFVTAVGTHSMRSCHWCAKFVSVPTSRLKGITGLKNVRHSGVPPEILFHEAELWECRDSTQYTCFWQIHDAVTKKWCWLSTNGMYIMPWEDDPLQVYGLPFEVLTLNTNTKSIFATPDPKYIMTQHLEGEDCRWQGMKQRRAAISKFLYKADSIDSETLDRIISADSPAGIPVDVGMDKSIRDCILELKGSVDFGLLEYQKAILNDAQLILGNGPNQLGQFAPGRRSSREAGIVDRVADSRVSHRRGKVADVAQGLVRKANRLMTENWNGELIQQVVGADGALYWVEADPKKLGELGFGMETRVNVESLAPVSRDSRKQEAANLLSMMSQMQETGANTMPILTQLLSQFEWVDVSQVLPQSAQRYSMEAFQQQQEEMIAKGGLGEVAANNTRGVGALADRLPATPAMGGEEDDS